MLRLYLDVVKGDYDYILIDCMPSLGMITINALVAADSVLIPVEAAYLPVKGLQQLIKTIGKVHRRLNPRLSILGILLTKVDRRTNFARDISEQIRFEAGRTGDGVGSSGEYWRLSVTGPGRTTQSYE